mgnify:FL=1
MGQALDGTGVYGNGNTGGNFNGIAAGLLASANTTVNPVGISVTAQGDLTPITAQLYTTKTGTTATDTYGISNVVLNPTIVTSGNDRTYGEYNVVDRISATGGTIETYGSYIGVTGDNAGSGTHTAYGLYVNMGAGPDNVYASIFDGGNVGIGDTTPDAPLDIVGDVYISDGLSLYETIVSDGTIEATKFCTGDGETNCVTDFSSLIGGSSIWTDAGSYLYLSAGEVLGNPSSGGINKLDGI